MVVYAFVVFFFFKQKTAYEMRISDWSSDVCSSDLCAPAGVGAYFRTMEGRTAFPVKTRGSVDNGPTLNAMQSCAAFGPGAFPGEVDYGRACGGGGGGGQAAGGDDGAARGPEGRSEEHTSELQSLMRNSYAVFCLKKK